MEWRDTIDANQVILERAKERKSRGLILSRPKNVVFNETRSYAEPGQFDPLTPVKTPSVIKPAKKILKSTPKKIEKTVNDSWSDENSGWSDEPTQELASIENPKPVEVTFDSKKDLIKNVDYGVYLETEAILLGVIESSDKVQWPTELIKHSAISPYAGAVKGTLDKEEFPGDWKVNLPREFNLDSLRFDDSPTVTFKFNQKQTEMHIFGVQQPYKILGIKGGLAKQLTKMFRCKGMQFPNAEQKFIVNFATNDRYIIQKGAVLFLASHLHNNREKLPGLRKATFMRLCHAVIEQVSRHAFAYPLAVSMTAFVKENGIL